MSYHHAYLRIASGIVSKYNGDEPFSAFLKKYFAANRQHGSRDRRQITQLCYCYFRTGKAATDLEITTRMVAGLFLSSNSPNEMLGELRPEWNNETGRPLKEKSELAGVPLPEVFPWKQELSEGIDYEKFINSFFIQPDLFLRIRPGQKEAVIQKLETSGVAFSFIPPHTLQLPIGSKTEEWLELDREVVVQDRSSQRVGEFMELVRQSDDRRGYSDIRSKVWDCCAASGGKSILAKDMLGGIDLTVSDVRESILINLKKRFEKAGIKQYTSFVSDLAGDGKLPGQPVDLVIADVPCTGSGTWGRTPEQLFYFDEKKIGKYSSLQKKIISGISPAIRDRGYLLYITCSVFRRENEDMLSYLEKELQFRVLKSELLKGYTLKADTLFAALLEKPL